MIKNNFVKVAMVAGIALAASPMLASVAFGYGGGGGGGGNGVSCNLTVSPTVVSLGSSATLSWSGILVSTADINNGTTNQTVVTGGTVPGSIVVTPATVGNTNYLGTFKGSGGTTYCSVTLHVAASESNVGNAPGLLNNRNNGQVLGAAVYNFTKSLSVGSRGADVTALQQNLIDNGFSVPAGATGYFGAQTKTAVMAFQKARGIAQVGNVGPLTRAELNKGIIATTPTTTQLASSGLTATQGAAILGLLQSFNADASVIANVKTSLGL